MLGSETGSVALRASRNQTPKYSSYSNGCGRAASGLISFSILYSIQVSISEQPLVSQPAPFSRGGQTVVVPRTTIDVNTGADVRLGMLDGGVTLQDLVTGLNKLGVAPRDTITILQAVKTAGALQAEITTM